MTDSALRRAVALVYRLRKMTPTPLRANLEYDSASSSVTIEIFDIVDPNWGVSVMGIHDKLKAYGKLETIRVLIHSRGGNALEGFAIYSLLRMHSARIEVDIIGLAASSASVIAMAGDVVRIATVGFLMIHDPWCACAGNPERLRKTADHLDALKPSIIRAYRRRATPSDAEISALMSNDGGAGTWLDASRAKELGFVTEVFETDVPQNAVRLDDLPNVPEGAMRFVQNAAPPPPADPGPSEEEQHLEALLAELAQLNVPDEGSLLTPSEEEALLQIVATGHTTEEANGH